MNNYNKLLKCVPTARQLVNMFTYINLNILTIVIVYYWIDFK